MEGTSAWGMFVMFLKRLGSEGHILISKGFFLRQFAVFLEESSPFISINYVWSHSTEAGRHRALATSCYRINGQWSSATSIGQNPHTHSLLLIKTRLLSVKLGQTFSRQSRYNFQEELKAFLAFCCEFSSHPSWVSLGPLLLWRNFFAWISLPDSSLHIWVFFRWMNILKKS